MTLINLIETLQQIFTNLVETQLVKEVDYVQKKIAADSKCLVDTATLTDIDSHIAWTIPAEVVEVKDLNFYDADLAPLYLGSYNLDYKIEGRILSFYSKTSTALSDLSSTFTYIDVSYYTKTTTLTATTSSLELPEELHDGLEAKVFERCYSRFPTVNDGGVLRIDYGLVRYWNSQYKEIQRDALKKGTKGLNSKMRNPIQYQYAGKFNLPKGTRISTPSNTWTGI